MKFSHADLPPLGSLRAFEAAARLENFTAAAQELHITQSAISHAIQGLETTLSVRLFVRSGPRVSLTPVGRDYADALAGVFAIIAAATSQVRGTVAPNVLTVSMLPSFAMKWFTPRLSAFIEAHPAIDLRISATTHPSRFDDGVDVAIRFGSGNWADTESEFLFREEVFPVCSPRLAETAGPLTTLENFTGAVLLHGEIPDDWKAWCAAAGLGAPASQRGPRFTDGASLLQAAIDGIGVALGRTLLVHDDLEAGRLIRPFDTAIDSSLAFYLTTPNWRPKPPHFDAFRSWIMDQMRGM